VNLSCFQQLDQPCVASAQVIDPHGGVREHTIRHASLVDANRL
jgi:hypothetical protein